MSVRLLQTVLLLLASFALQQVFAIPTIAVKGAKFFASGQQFFLKGVAYQGTPSDPLHDTSQCQLDASAMQTIGTNSIRVYHVDPDVDHDGCMKAFANAGIYVWLDLDTFSTMINQTAPTWTEDQFRAFAKVMDVFQAYDNLAGFWIGNEVINTAAGSPSAPFVKAAVADMKSYMAAKKYRTIPIGYSAADIAELRPMLQNYLACGSHAEQAIDFFGLNSYEWCGDATYQTSGYRNLQQMSATYSIPIFFSETGCNAVEPRTFGDQADIYGQNMVDTWSGSIIYEWVQEANNYGLVTYANGEIYNGAPIPLSPEYQNLADQWKSINPTGVSESTYTPSYAAPACPLATGGWAVNGDVPLPTLGSSVVLAAAANAVTLPSSSSTPGVSTSSSSDSTPSTHASSPASRSSPSVPSSQAASSSPTTKITTSHDTDGAIPTSPASTTFQSSSVVPASASAASAAPSTTTSHSSAPSVLMRSSTGFWSRSNLTSITRWLLTIILPISGVVGIVSFL